MVVDLQILKEIERLPETRKAGVLAFVRGLAVEKPEEKWSGPNPLQALSGCVAPGEMTSREIDKVIYGT